jgi:histidinol-phosphatase (PHP family)
MMKLLACCGVSGENPENTMPAFQAAVDQGYAGFSVNVRVTKDGHCVALRDHTINRTALRPDGSAVGAALPVADLTLAQLREFDFGLGYHVKFKGTEIPLLEDVLELAHSAGVRVKVDGVFALRQAHKEAVLALLDGYADTAELSVANGEALQEVLARYPGMQVHYVGPVTKDTVAAIAQGARVTVWISWNDRDLIAEALAHGPVGVTGLGTAAQLAATEALGVTVAATNGALKPEQNKGVLCDMHVHTNHSHDARYPMEEMVLGGLERGITVMAMADHCDVTRCENDPNWDIYTHIRESCDEVDALNEKYAGQCLLLRSVELGDGVWHPEQSGRVATQLPYDVVVGATHAVRCEAAEAIPLKEKWYSQIKFMEITDAQFDELMRNYFDDMLHMVRTQNIDIMAHILCASCYYGYRYGIWKDMRPYEAQITEILKTIIAKGIAMEMSAQLLLEIDGVRPYYWVVEKYFALGGYLLTLSTDAHDPREVGTDYPRRIAMLKETGFTHMLYYKDRKAVPCSL